MNRRKENLGQPGERFSWQYFHSLLGLSNYGRYEWFDNDKYWSPFMQDIDHYLPQSQRTSACDVGGAYGYLAKRLKQICGFKKVYCTHVSDHSYQVSQKTFQTAGLNIDQDHPDINIVKWDLNSETSPFPPGTQFKYMSVFDVLEHTNRLDVSLGRMASYLSQDGLCNISVPVQDNWGGRLGKSLVQKLDHDSTHVSVPTKKQLFDAIEQAGLKVLEERAYCPVFGLRLRWPPTNIELALGKV